MRIWRASAAKRSDSTAAAITAAGCTGRTSSRSLPAVIREMLATTTSEREGRGVDKDGAASLEKRKHEGYF